MGKKLQQSTYFITRWIFLRTLGAVYFVAFASLGSQIPGLVGSHGLISSPLSDSWIRFLCSLGWVGALLLILGFAPAPVLLILWGSYSILAENCREFLWFQWDGLMLEMGFMALFLAPWTLLPKSIRRVREEVPPSSTVIFLLRCLLFKVIFLSGWVKLASGDATWRDLTALTYHYETQPLPTWVGWYAHLLPLWFQKFSVVMMFGVELVVPFLIFTTRSLRIVAAIIFFAFQILLDLTGNYGFFGWQTVALSLFLLDDGFWDALFRKCFRRYWPHGELKKPIEKKESDFKRWFSYGLAVAVLYFSLFQGGVIGDWARSYRVINSYGVFAVMTTSRTEIVIEGSQNGVDWKSYEFKWKPGGLKRAPAFMEPHMPRLDWQMWFAALGSIEDNPWLLKFMAKLLEGDPVTLSLIETNPFSDHPPRYVRALRYEYHFTDWKARQETGDWWRRELIGSYSSEFSLKVSNPPESESSRSKSKPAGD